MGKNQSKEEQHDNEPELSAEEIRQRRLKKLEQISKEQEQEVEERKDENLHSPEKITHIESQQSKDAMRNLRLQATEKTAQEKAGSPSKTAMKSDQTNQNESTINEKGNSPSKNQSPQKNTSKPDISPENASNLIQISSEKHGGASNTDHDSSKIEAMTKPNHPVLEKHNQEVYNIHSFFEDIFQFTFYPQSLARNPDLRLLPDDDHFEVFTVEKFDDIVQKVLESTKYFSSDEKLIFLHNIYIRLLSSPLSDQIDQEKNKELRKIAMSYIISYLTSPEIFSSDIQPENPLNIRDLSCSLYDMFYSQLLQFDQDDFIKEFIVNVGEEDFDPIFTPVLKRVLRDCNECSIETVKKLVKGLELIELLFTVDKRFIDFFFNHYLFIPKSNLTGLTLQKLTIFGSALSITAFPEESNVLTLYFNDPMANLRHAEPTQNMLRFRINEVIDIVHRILENVMRIDAKYKRNILDWFYCCISVNEAKQKTFNMGAAVSSNGWFTNFVLLLTKFCHKLLEDVAKYPGWFKKIDVHYLKEKPIFNNVVLLNGKSNLYIPPSMGMDNENKNQESKYTFLTELVFLINHALFLQTKTIKSYTDFYRKLADAHRANPKSPETLQLYARKNAYDIQLLDPELTIYIHRLLAFNALFIISLTGTKLDKVDEACHEIFIASELLMIEKDENAVDTNASLPAYWAENIQEYLTFIRYYDSKTLQKNPLIFEINMNFIVRVLGSKNWIKNPHLKAGCTQLLATLIPRPENKGSATENFLFLFKDNPYFKQYLVPNLIRFFIEAEKTGSNNQFFDKFNYRHGCCMIINYLLKAVFPGDQTSYVKDSLEKLANQDSDTYLQFIMLYLNDIIYLMDESFEKLRKIKEYQDEVETPEFQALPYQEKHIRMANFEENKRLVQPFLALFYEYYGMIASITLVSRDFFLTDAIKDKFVTNLNHCLKQLNGKEALNLKVKNMKEFNFDPKLVLESIINVYLNFADKEEFYDAVVRDERSYDIELFLRTKQILEKLNLLDSDQIDKFDHMIRVLKEKEQEKKDEDKFISEITDIPDEFLDPILGEIMRDPVLLPTSNVIVDRLTITKHLLSDDTDPFNRAKLTKEMLIPQPELKKRIEEFFAEKKRERQK